MKIFLIVLAVNTVLNLIIRLIEVVTFTEPRTKTHPPSESAFGVIFNGLWAGFAIYFLIQIW